MKYLLNLIAFLSGYLSASEGAIYEPVDRSGIVELPYGSFRVVHQDEVVIMTQESPFHFLLMGPLRPCQGIVIDFNGYIIAYHRSQFTSLSYLPQLVRHLKKNYNLPADRQPRVLIYSAAMDELCFRTSFKRHYEVHYKNVSNQQELMAAVKDEIADILEIERERITIDINDSKQSYNGHSGAEVIAIGKDGETALSFLDDHKYPKFEASTRIFACIEAIFGKMDTKCNFYPPYIHAEYAPEAEFCTFEQPVTNAQWPGYYHACGYCESLGKQHIVGVERSPYELPELTACKECDVTMYCSEDCRLADREAGHKDLCSGEQHQ